MRDDEVKARLEALESRVDILEGNPVKEKPKPQKKAEVIEQKPKMGTTTEPFNPDSKGAPKPAAKPKATTTTEVLEGEEKILEAAEKFDKEESKATGNAFKDEQITKVKPTKSKPLDIDPLDKHLNDERLKAKYGDRVEEAKKLIAELDNEK